MFEVPVERASFAQAIEPLPHAIPFPEAFRLSAPGDVVNSKIMRGL